MKILRGRTAFVTGAASGIGRAIALRLAQSGVHLIVTDRHAAQLDETVSLVASRGVNVASFVCDLTQPAAITAALAGSAMRAPLHIVVNCAGLTWYGLQHAMSDSDWRDIMAVNLLAPMQITTELLGKLLGAPEAHLVNIASMFGLAPGRKLSTYTASKYGLVGFSLALRSDYKRPGFGISVVCPGFVRTPMLVRDATAEEPKMPPHIPNWLSTTPEHVADAVLSAILRDRGLVTVGPVAGLLWRLNGVAPGLIDFLNREGWRTRGPLRLPADSGAPPADRCR